MTIYPRPILALSAQQNGAAHTIAGFSLFLIDFPAVRPGADPPVFTPRGLSHAGAFLTISQLLCAYIVFADQGAVFEKLLLAAELLYLAVQGVPVFNRLRGDQVHQRGVPKIL